ncbi:MAG: RidA family protein [Gemmatimonadaceae bacterium]|nr:RidA family protein [Gemmatimonadaceae bacterium]
MTLRPALLALCAVALAATGCRAVRERRTARVADRIAAGDTAVYLTPFGAPTRPFSPAVRVGNLIYLSGQIGLDNPAANGSTLVPGGIEAETRQTLENIKATLAAVGSSMDRVIKCTVMMADMKEWDRMNAIYRTYFAPGRLPARSALGANGLALGARVEIECIATA